MSERNDEIVNTYTHTRITRTVRTIEFNNRMNAFIVRLTSPVFSLLRRNIQRKVCWNKTCHHVNVLHR